jgi:protein O-GlcNAc transferase
VAGYPATSGGVDDVLAADPIVLPPDLTPPPSERVLYLPLTYFAADHKILYPRPLAQVDCLKYNVTARDVVLANFGQLYKVTPASFRIWMDVLKAVPATKLWLLRFPELAAPNVAAAATAAGLPPSRLILTPLLPLKEHVAIKSCAHLVADTFEFNGHTTGVDPLWGGVPLVSLPGDRMAARSTTPPLQNDNAGGSSFLNALGLTRLVARNADDYRGLLLTLARNKARLERVRAELNSKVEGAALFNFEGWVRGWETALALLWEGCAVGAQAHTVAAR